MSRLVTCFLSLVLVSCASRGGAGSASRFEPLREELLSAREEAAAASSVDSPQEEEEAAPVAPLDGPQEAGQVARVGSAKARSQAPVLMMLIPAGVAVLQSVLTNDSDAGLWFAFAGQGSIGDPVGPWRWWFDAHARFFEDSDGFETSIVRPGVGYEITDNAQVWLGYAWIHNDTPSESFNEHRIWQQLTWGKKYDWGTPFLRTRLEQRFDERDGDVGVRLRQFLRWTRPVCEGSRLNFRAWNEVFIDLNETDWGQDPGLSQNRAFAGLGWDLDETGRHTLEFGYLNQYIHRDGAQDSANHILGITLLSNF